MDPRFKLLNIWIFRLNNIVYYTMEFYRQILARKAQHSSHNCWHMFRAENVVPNFISAPISVETAVMAKLVKSTTNLKDDVTVFFNIPHSIKFYFQYPAFLFQNPL